MTADLPDLYPGERLLWQGAPARFPFFQAEDKLGVPFGLMFVAFSIGWTMLAGRNDQTMTAFGVFFTVVGLYHAVGKLVVRALALRRTTYLLTDRRLVIRSALWGRRRESTFYLRELPPPILAEGDGMVGTIRFGSTSAGASDEHPTHAEPEPGRRLPLPIIVEVDGARRVRDTIATMQAQAPRSTSPDTV